MALPGFDDRGDLPNGLHPASLAEVAERFGQGSDARRVLTDLLQSIYQKAAATGKLSRFVIFGSFVTAKTEPRDIDIVMVMKDNFSLAAYDEETRVLFDHQRAEDEIGASIFWVCPSVLLRETLDEFV
jgi:predicted nucleotidyltransferase